MASSERGPQPGPLGQLDHVGVVVADLGQARGFFEETIGLEVSSEATLPEAGMKICFLRSGPVRVELIEVTDPERRRERLGEAEARIEHIAFRVEQVEPAAEIARERGVELRGGIGPKAPESAFEGAGTRSFFSRPESSAGVMVQLVQLLDRKGTK